MENSTRIYINLKNNSVVMMPTTTHFYNLAKSGYFLRRRSRVASEMLVLNTKNVLASGENEIEFSPEKLRSVW